MRVCLLVSLLGILFATAVHAQNVDLNRANNTVNNIRQADPPSVSTGTVVTPNTTQQQMPNGGSDVHRMINNPPPSPSH
jgi:hypothetical protein